MNLPTIHKFKNYVVRVLHENEEDCHVDVEVFAIAAEDEDEKPLFERRGATNSMDVTEDIENAQRVFNGMIKWDGCSHLNFFPDEEGYVHYCGKSSAVQLGELVGFVYDKAREEMADKVHDLDLYENT